MTKFLERYLAGECEQVWDELYELGEEVRDPAYFDDAVAVARETMTRVRKNCEILIPRLQELGWRFGYDWAGKSAKGEIAAQPPLLGEPAPTAILDKIEADNGSLPISLRAFYEVVGAINFVGTPFKRDNWPGIEDGLDPLYIAGISRAFGHTQTGDFDEEKGDFNYIDTGDTFVSSYAGGVEIAPDFLHKFFISGVGSLYVKIPGSAADAPLMFEDEPMQYNDADYTFVRYLRNAMKGGGFLAFEGALGWAENERDPSEWPVEDMAFLTEGLLAF